MEAAGAEALAPLPPVKPPPLFIAPEAIDPPRVTLRGDTAHRLQHTLRLHVGDRIRVGDGAGTLHTAEVQALRRDAVDAVIQETTRLPPEPGPRLEIVQVLPKPALADRILAPCTTLGVSAFRFARGERTPVSGAADEWSTRLERWRRIVRLSV